MSLCPNCGEPVERDSQSCVLHSLIQVLRDRCEHTEEQLLDIHANVSVDALWFNLSVVLDRLGRNIYRVQDPPENSFSGSWGEPS